MSQLIEMRQRIRAIETIKKITHAMQLISMSLHLRLQKQARSREHYRQTLLELLQLAQAAAPALIAPVLPTDQQTPQPTVLLILVSAQKGLCGNFNSELLQFVEQYYAQLQAQQPESQLAFVCIGAKKMAHELQKRRWTVLREFSQLKIANLNQISRELFQFIQAHQLQYPAVRCIYTKAHSFFARQPTVTDLYPLNLLTLTEPPPVQPSDYLWPETPQRVYEQVIERYLHYLLQSALFESLLAEQAARFRSMDTANRNASELLEQTYRDYNKLRQHKITKELIELATAFQR